MPVYLTHKARLLHATARELEAQHTRKREARAGGRALEVKDAVDSIDELSEQLSQVDEMPDHYKCAICERTREIGDQIQIMVTSFHKAKPEINVHYRRGEERVLIICPGCDAEHQITAHISSDDAAPGED